MENASKALIIAGAILLAILIISLGILIFTQAQNIVNNSSMDDVEITAFNEKFRQYEGSNVKGATVNSLLNAVVSNNITNQDDTSRLITIVTSAANWQSGTKPTGTITSISSKAQTGRTYTVKCDYDTKTGLVNKITISDPS